MAKGSALCWPLNYEPVNSLCWVGLSIAWSARCTCPPAWSVSSHCWGRLSAGLFFCARTYPSWFCVHLGGKGLGWLHRYSSLSFSIIARTNHSRKRGSLAMPSSTTTQDPITAPADSLNPLRETLNNDWKVVNDPLQWILQCHADSKDLAPEKR